MHAIRIATRASRLATIQARLVADGIEAQGRSVEIVPITTRGDRVADRSLTAIGGDGVFVKELETALLQGRADIAVHSMKDLPTETTPGVRNAAILEREDPRDALVTRDRESIGIASLPSGAVLGTSSLRRSAFVRLARHDLDIRDIRGNVDTRVRKVLDGHYDAAILALAGLRRAQLLDTLQTVPLSITEMTPAAGQGAICAQCRADDEDIFRVLAPLDHARSAIETAMERALLRRMGGGCIVPIGVSARVDVRGYEIHAVVAAVDGSSAVRQSASGGPTDEVAAVAAAEHLADDMLAAGARELVDIFRAGVTRQA